MPVDADDVEELLAHAAEVFVRALAPRQLWASLVVSIANEVANLLVGDLTPDVRVKLVKIAERLEHGQADEDTDLLQEMRRLRDSIAPPRFQEMVEGLVGMTAAGFATVTLNHFLDDAVTDLDPTQLILAAVTPAPVFHASPPADPPKGALGN